MKEDNMKQGWEIKKLGEVCEVIGGSTPKTNEPTYWDGDFFWVTPAELDGTKLISSTKRTITEAGIKSAHLQLLPAGTVLLSSRAPIGKVAITTVPMYCNQGFKNIICSDKLYNCYVYWFLYAKTEYLNALGTGATFKEISKKVVEQIPIPVPPLPVQEQIVSELDLLSGIIEKKREQLKELNALAQSIFYDMFGDPITNEKGWEVKKLGEVCESVSYGTSNSSTENGEYKYLRMNNITYSGHIDITDIKYIDISDDEYEKYVVRKGDILFNRTNSKDLVGKTALFNFEEEMIIAGYIIRVRVNQDSIIPTFVVKWLNTPLMKSYFKNICKGAVNQSNINSKELKNIPISIPPLPLQHQFASKIEAIEKQKELIKQSISETETLFNERMQEHFG